MSRESFPDDFLWGTATASYQIEGAAFEDGKGKNIWDTFSHTKGCIAKGQNGDVACDHYHKFKEDVALIKELGTNSYRFSISWSRILPQAKVGTEVNKAGLEFYNNLIDELLKNGITPLVTLYHWDLPQVLMDEFKGFVSKEIVEHFEHYARVCFENFGDRVKNWITFNEPWVICALGFAVGAHAPGRRSNGGVEPYLAAHHLLLSHGSVYRMYHNEFNQANDGKVGITLNCEWFEPVIKGKNEKADEKTRQNALQGLDFMMGWFANPVYVNGDYPECMKKVFRNRKGLKEKVEFTDEEKEMLKGSSDFFGLNHYSTQFVYIPQTLWEKITIPIKGAWGMFKQLFEENASWTAALSVAFNVAFKKNYVKDIGVNLWLKFYAPPDATEEEKIDYGITHMNWRIVPYGFRKLLNYIQDKYNPAGGIIVTENGLALKEKNVEEAIDDSENSSGQKRIKFYDMYISQMRKAMENGADVKGYFAWSLMDNFEWAYGFEKRFGLLHVDYETLVRTKRPVFNWYQELVTTNQLPK